MNNWDIKPSMTVVYGEHIAIDVLTEVGAEYVGSDYDPTLILPIQDIVVYDAKNMVSGEHIDTVIYSIQDHLHNVADSQWLKHVGNLEVKEPIADRVENTLLVSVSKGTYWGPNCKVTVYKVDI